MCASTVLDGFCRWQTKISRTKIIGRNASSAKFSQFERPKYKRTSRTFDKVLHYLQFNEGKIWRRNNHLILNFINKLYFKERFSREMKLKLNMSWIKILKKKYSVNLNFDFHILDDVVSNHEWMRDMPLGWHKKSFLYDKLVNKALYIKLQT